MHDVAHSRRSYLRLFFFQAEDGIRDKLVTGVQTCALPILNAVAVMSAPARAASRRGRRAGTHARIQRSLTRNQHPAAIALVTAASRLIRVAYPAASGSKPQVCALSTNRGFPGGCGRPSTCAAAVYSDVSQNCVGGASGATYRTRAARVTRPASR